jgi:hypothetical protein
LHGRNGPIKKIKENWMKIICVTPSGLFDLQDRQKIGHLNAGKLFTLSCP